MNFERALPLIKGGKKLSRKGWNGVGQYIVLAFLQEAMLATGEAIFAPEHEAIGTKFLMCVGNDGYRCGWSPSQVDILAEDWEVVQC